MKSKSLYELTVEYTALETELLENGGELTEELEALMEDHDVDYQTKILNYARVVKNIQSGLDPIEAEIDRLTKRKKTIKNAASRLKESMLASMRACNETKIFDELITVAVQGSADKISITGEVRELPDMYVTTKTTTDVNKKQILADFKAGTYVETPGIEIITNNCHLRIK
jgi:chaperonin cofactor prefoldin